MQRWFPLLLTVFLKLPIEAQNAEYALSLHRAAKVGDRSEFVAVVSSADYQVVKIEEKQMAEHKESLSVSLSGERDVTAVSETGVVTAIKAKIKRALVTENDKEVLVFAPNDVVEIMSRANIKNEVKVNGVSATALQYRAAKAALNEGFFYSFSLDEISTPGKKAKQGEEWRISEENLRRHFAEPGIEIRPDVMSADELKAVHLSGQCRLTNIADESGTRILQVNTSIRHNLTPPVKPKNRALKSMAFEATQSGEYPENPSTQIRRRKLTAEVNFSVESEGKLGAETKRTTLTSQKKLTREFSQKVIE